MKILFLITLFICLSEANKFRISDYPQSEPFPTTPEEEEIYKIIGYKRKTGTFTFKDKSYQFNVIEYFEGPRRSYLTTIKSGEAVGIGRDYSMKRAYIQAYRNCLSKMNSSSYLITYLNYLFKLFNDLIK